MYQILKIKELKMKKVIIIGAGPAGITAAFELSKNKNYDITILEASGCLGGISQTCEYKGNRMDIGGHRFFSKDDRVTKWWLDLMPVQGEDSFDDKLLHRKKDLNPGGPDPEKTDRVMLKRHRVSRIYYKKKFFDYPVSLKWNTIRNMGFFTTVKAGTSYLYSCLHKLPETSLENFYINRFGRVLYSMFFEGYTEKLWGRHPSQISADWGSQRVKGLSVKAVLADMIKKIIPALSNSSETETSLIEEYYYPKLGPGQLWELAAKESENRGVKIIKNAEVQKINTENGKVTSVIYSKNGRNILESADIFISSMPLKDLTDGMNDVPEDIHRIANGLPYRDFVTVGLEVDRLNLKNETGIPTLGNIVPDCWIYVQDTGVKLGRIQIFNNWSPYMVEDPCHKVWIGLEYFCNEGDSFWNMSEIDCIKLARHELIKMGVLSKGIKITKANRIKVKKAYPAYFDTYRDIDRLTGYLDGFENLYCIGRNGQHRYNNMDHSMATAFEAVKNIESGRKDKHNIWSVNTDKSYNETKNHKE